MILFRLKPTYFAERVTDINLENLKNDGIKGFIFDLDNTLMAPKSGSLYKEIENWLVEVQKEFKIAVVSNNPEEDYVADAQKLIGCPVYAKADKPRRAITRQALKEIDLLPSQVAMVGDRPLTDILVGHRLGLTTILVDPLIKHQESKVVKCLRKLERMFVTNPKKNFS